MPVPSTFADATHIDISAEVRYWEDSTINGVADDERGSRIPGRQGAFWKIRIRLSDGLIENWPAHTSANIHYKVCDQGQYWLSNNGGQRLAKWRDDYVPNQFLCHGDNGHGDYIIFRVDKGGAILDYSRPDIDDAAWRIVAQDGLAASPVTHQGTDK